MDVKAFGVITFGGPMSDEQFARLKQQGDDLKEATGLSEVIYLEKGCQLRVEPGLCVWTEDVPTEQGWYRIWDPVHGTEVVCLGNDGNVGVAGNDVWEHPSHYTAWLWDHRKIEFDPMPGGEGT